MPSPRTEKMDQALKIVVERVAVTLADTPQPTFEHHNQNHPLTCGEECIFAGAQRIRKHIESILEEIRAENDYYLEKAALILLEISKANESLAQYTAEIHQSYSTPQQIYTLFPHLEHMATEGQHMFSSLTESGVLTPPVTQSK